METNTIQTIQNSNLWGNGTPFLEIEKLDYFLKGCINEVNHDKAIVIVIGGPQSSAKTTLGVLMADRVNQLVGKPELNLTDTDNPQYSQGSKNFMRKLNESRAKGHKVIIWDETAADYRKKRSISNLNKTLDEAFDMIRAFRMIVILVYHDFSEIPKELITKKVITCLFQNEDRDVNKDYVISKAYNYGKMCIIKNNLTKSIIPEYAFSIEPNFHLHFKNLSPERSEQLKILSSNIKFKIFENAEIALNGLLSQDAIADKTGMSKAWVRKQIKALGITHERIVNKVTYYPAGSLERIKTKIKRKS